MTVNSNNLRGYQRFGKKAGITEQEIVATFTGMTSMNIFFMLEMHIIVLVQQLPQEVF